jgi:N-acetylglucosamine-6-phosphate deacetylase
VTPGVFDPQVNGYAGVDFQRDDVMASSLRTAAAAWRRDGGGRFFLTLITDAWPALVERLRRFRAFRAADPELQQVIAGWHVEGPFLSEKPGFCGAHDASVMRDPTPDLIRELRDAAGDDPLLITLAPERKGAIDAIALASELGIQVSLGHTDASAADLRDAIEAGATAFTHLGNGCPQTLDRHDNIVWRVLDAPGLRVGLIADGIHVSPALFRLIHRVLPPDRIYYTTDAMAAAGAPPGRFTLGRLQLEVGADGVVRQPGRTNFAGSSLRPSEIAPRANAMLGPGHEEIVARIIREAENRFRARSRTGPQR